MSVEEYIEFLDETGLDYNLNEPFKGTDLTIEVEEELDSIDLEEALSQALSEESD